jgi:protein-S-isoprenylcysteine O-methyltransferase Ste14
MAISHAYQLATMVVDGCWLAFIVFWILASFGTKQTVYSETIAQRFAVQLVIALGVLIQINAPREPYPLNVFFIPQNAIVAFISAAICVCGLAFTLWARLTLGRNWSARVTLKADHELIQSGPYALVRHPIYTGLFAMALGSALLIGRIGALIGYIFFVAGFVLKAGREESLMMQQFPEQYAAYRQRTKRVVPFIL